MSNIDASPATRKLYDCMLAVEACGASDALTAAINGLGQLDAMLHEDVATHQSLVGENLSLQTSLAAALQVIEDVRKLAEALEAEASDSHAYELAALTARDAVTERMHLSTEMAKRDSAQRIRAITGETTT